MVVPFLKWGVVLYSHGLSKPEEGANILVVEDNDRLASILVDFLRMHGFRSERVNNGVDAVIKCLKGDIAMVITDVFLPRLSGIDLIRILKAADAPIRVIAITGSLSETIRGEMKCLGVRGFFTKPLKMEELIAVVNDSVSERPH